MDGTVLVADDDRTIRTVLTQALTRAGCRVHATGSLVTLKRWVEEGRGDLVISDVVMPDGNGLQALPEIANMRPDLPVIVISAQNTIMTAIQAAEAEAFDYLPKPFDLPDLMKRVSTGLKRKRLRPSGPEAAAQAGSDLPLVGHSPVMQDLYRLVARVMNTDLPVLITGASGTGKSLIARALHDYSDRRERPFVVITADDFSAADTVGEMIRQAGQGTLVFDEVSDLTPAAQARLTRYLDIPAGEGPRVLATSQSNLEAARKAGHFREDLYYRLGGVTINVPLLRDRSDDIPELAAHFLGLGAQDGRARSLTAAASDLLRAYPWPGNIRQLENTMQRLLVTGTDPEISSGEIETALGAVSMPAAGPEGDSIGLGGAVSRHIQRYFDLHGGELPPAGLYERILREIELPLLEISLDATGGNQAKCAELLGINRNTLRKKLTNLEIEVTRRRKLM
ncbi:MAG TPA: response regulator [Aliiroseovarius sp.]|nr:response regulator [Aliiroseovarius sp.]